MDATRMLLSSPAGSPVDAVALVECIESCFTAAQAATACADACLAQPSATDHRTCIAACVSLADVAGLMGRELSRMSRWDDAVIRNLLEACAKAALSCAEACDQHAQSDKHCRVCREACRRCEQGCQRLLVAAAA